MAHLLGVRNELYKLGLNDADIKEIIDLINSKLLLVQSSNPAKGSSFLRRIKLVGSADRILRKPRVKSLS